MKNHFNLGVGFLTHFALTILFLCTGINGYSQSLSFHWTENIKSTGRINPSEVLLDANKNVVVAGNFIDTLFFGKDTLVSPGSFNGFIAVFDSTGVHKWIKTLNSPKFSGVSNIVAKNTGYIISGIFQDSLYFNGPEGMDTIVHNGYASNFFISMDAEGDFEWFRSYGLNSFGNRTLFKEIENDNYLFTGSFNGSMVLEDTLIIEGKKGVFGITFNENATFSPAYVFGNQGEIVLSDVLPGAANSLILCGYFKGKVQVSEVHELSSVHARNGFLMRLDADLQIDGIHVFESYMDNFPQKLLMDSTGRLIMAGEFSGCMASGMDTLCAEGKKDLYFASFTPSFELIGLTNMGGTALKQFGGMKLNKFGDLLVTGNFRGEINIDSIHIIESDPEFFDIFMAKYDSEFQMKRLSHFSGSRSNQARNLLMDEEGYYYYYGSFSESFTFGQQVLEGKGSDVVVSRFFDCDYKKALQLSNSDTTFCGAGELWAPEGFIQYEWSNGYSSINTYTETEGWIRLTVTDTYGCTSNDSVYVMINPLPQINLPDTILFCKGDSIWLDAGAAGLSYLWSTGDETARIGVATAGVYSVVVTSIAQCSDSASVVLIEYDNPVIQLEDYYQLENGEEISLYPGSFSEYYWSNGHTGSTLVINGEALDVGIYNYQIDVTTFDGCNLNKEFTVEKTETRLSANKPAFSPLNASLAQVTNDENTNLSISDLIAQNPEQLIAGIEIAEEGLSFEIWPNPCKDFFNYKFNTTSQITENYSILLVNSQAKIIKQISCLEHAEGFATGKISVENVLPGVYFVLFKQNEGISIKRIVIL